MRNALTAERLRQLLNYDAVTGLFTWLVEPNGGKGRIHIGDVAGTRESGTGCIRIFVDGKSYYAHRLAWLYVRAEWPANGIGHEDGEHGHNWFDNLKPATLSESQQKKTRPRSDSKSGVPGASWHRQSGKWRARIEIGGTRKDLGSFSTLEEAGAAYLAAKAKHRASPPGR